MSSIRENERVVLAQAIEALRHSTEVNERLVGQLVNHTLRVWSGPMPAATGGQAFGFKADQFHLAAGSLQVTNWGSIVAGGQLIVSSAGPGDAAPTGVGTWQVFPGSSAVVPLASRQMTIYGPPGTQFGYMAFTLGVLPVTTSIATQVATGTPGAAPASITNVGTAGAEIIVTVPAATNWQIQSIDVSLTTSAAVASRTFVLIIDDGAGHILWQSAATAAQTAGLTVPYPYVEGGPAAAAALPLGMTLGPGMRIRTSSTNLQAGDQYTVTALVTQVNR